MSKHDLRQHVADFYGDKSLSSPAVARLVSLAEADRGERVGEVIHRRRGRWLFSMIGVAAGVALTLLAAPLFRVQDDAARNPADIASLLVVEKDSTGGSELVNGPSNSGHQLVPRLVAVNFQVDGCPAAARMEPVFTELVCKYADKRVMFARYDMTNEKSKRFSSNVATGLGINWACEGTCQSGTILLIDRERSKVLAKVTNGQNIPEMVRALDRALD